MTFPRNVLAEIVKAKELRPELSGYTEGWEQKQLQSESGSRDKRKKCQLRQAR